MQTPVSGVFAARRLIFICRRAFFSPHATNGLVLDGLEVVSKRQNSASDNHFGTVRPRVTDFVGHEPFTPDRHERSVRPNPRSTIDHLDDIQKGKHAIILLFQCCETRHINVQVFGNGTSPARCIPVASRSVVDIFKASGIICLRKTCREAQRGGKNNLPHETRQLKKTNWHFGLLSIKINGSPNLRSWPD